MTFILNLCFVASAASVAASIARILILMLAIDSASQKTYEKTYHTSQSEYWSKFHVTRSIEVTWGHTEVTVGRFFICDPILHVPYGHTCSLKKKLCFYLNSKCQTHPPPFLSHWNSIVPPPFCATEYFFSNFKSFQLLIYLLSKNAWRNF